MTLFSINYDKKTYAQSFWASSFSFCNWANASCFLLNFSWYCTTWSWRLRHWAFQSSWSVVVGIPLRSCFSLLFSSEKRTKSHKNKLVNSAYQWHQHSTNSIKNYCSLDMICITTLSLPTKYCVSIFYQSNQLMRIHTGVCNRINL